MVLHVKLFLVTQMIIHGTFAKNRVDSVVLAEENVAKNFLALELFHLLRQYFLPEFINKAVWGGRGY
jgi:hypothetical protein